MHNEEERVSAMSQQDKLDEFRIEEYRALRQEILYLMASRAQTLGLTVVAAGVTMGTGVQIQDGTALLLVYPVLAFFLALRWIGRSRSMYRAGRYIRDEIESRYGGRMGVFADGEAGQMALPRLGHDSFGRADCLDSTVGPRPGARRVGRSRRLDTFGVGHGACPLRG